ncbi:copper resistance protein NlpE N-terminal domain-containing protein [Pontibacter sp. JH31]|uniref:Copper resistance protein NlpE N-terminal domain-containing protein n=1 Tax=Pontibacter aquaedesilientis TaxID=2766980 RepID=A0ABR7XFV7_9BACT|nr:copper resistance protein NlpE [Pontibacter aquaedesilientis]MBD1397175.1 copper resistance protein NlpE N-terminal domain-containing protein [Pontibacter aquaedesilientis]
MKTILAFFILFPVTLCLSDVQAQSGRSYEEWLQESANGQKSVAKTSSPNKAKAPAAKSDDTSPTASPVMAAPTGFFKGTLPYADCQGIQTELTLNEGAGRTYSMKQIYLGKPADKGVVTSGGKWFLAKGNKQDPDAVVLQLIPTAGNIDPMYFLQVSDSEVKLLDRQQAEIKSHLNYSLKKQ